MPENKGSPEEQMAVLSEFTKIPGLGLSKAKKLYEAGYRSLEQLKQASFDELAQIPGIDENRAALIKRYFGEEVTEKTAMEGVAEKKLEVKPATEAKEEARVVEGTQPEGVTVRGEAPRAEAQGVREGVEPHPAEGMGVREGAQPHPEEDLEVKIIAEFRKIPGIGLPYAKKLYDAGFRSVEELRNASYAELKEIVDEKGATAIKNFIEIQKPEEKPGVEAKEEKPAEEIKAEAEVKEEEAPEVEGAEPEAEAHEGKKEEGVREEVTPAKPEAEVKEETGVGEGAQPQPHPAIKSKIAKVGLINGMKTKGMAARKPKAKPHRFISIAIVCILILASIIVIWYAFLPESRISIDGNIDDWAGVPKYADNSFASLDSINITEYSMLFEEKRINFFAKTAGEIFAAQNGVDTLFIFIDADSNPDTGYSIQGMGAEYKVEISGWDKQIHSASAQRFTGENNLNYSAWESYGEVRAEISANIVEGYIKIPNLEKPEAIFIMSHTENQNVNAKVCKAPVSPAYSTLVVTQRFVAGDVVQAGDVVLEITLAARAGSVKINSITVSNADVVLQKNELASNEEITVQAVAKQLNSGIAYKFAVEGVNTDTVVHITGTAGSAYFGALPEGITIDGAFGDWNSAIKGTDSAGDAPKNIDLLEYASNISNNAYFYMAVDGSMLAGCEIPVIQTRPAPNPIVGPVILRENLGKDIARVYIDLLNSTINTFNPAMLQHGYLIELEGRNGKVLSAKAWHWENGQKASEITNANINYAITNGKIEISADLSALSEIDEHARYFFEMTSWSGMKDSNLYAYTKDGVLRCDAPKNSAFLGFSISIGYPYPLQSRVPIWIYGNITPAGTYYIRITNLNTGESVGSASSPVATDSNGYFGTQLTNPGAEAGDIIQIDVFSDTYSTQLIVTPSTKVVTADDLNNPYIGGPAKDMSTTVPELIGSMFTLLLLVPIIARAGVAAKRKNK